MLRFTRQTAPFLRPALTSTIFSPCRYVSLRSGDQINIISYPEPARNTIFNLVPQGLFRYLKFATIFQLHQVPALWLSDLESLIELNIPAGF
jgi:hypothetical protein